MKYVLFAICLFLTGAAGFAQVKVRKLPPSINHPAINVSSPYMSFDGDALIFLSDNAEDYELTPFFTYRENNSDWKEPVVLPRSLYTKLNFLHGYTLGPEGRMLILSTLKSPGVGGYDLWISERKGQAWSEPKNLGIPINTRGNEACATLTPDGKTIYFMRCDKMDQKSASGCKIFMANKKSNGQWDEPVELPAIVNTGNSQSPRILADSETLIFSSDKFGGNKGGMDLYMTRFRNGQWSGPQALNFVNTEKDDQYVSVNGVGRYLLRDSPGARKSELVEYLIPAELRPKGLTRVDGKITGAAGEYIPFYVSVIEIGSGKRIFNGRPAKDGSFTLFLLEGSKYEISIDPEQSNVSYYSEQFDLTTEEIPQVEKVNATIKAPEAGDEFELNLVGFKPGTSDLLPSSEGDLKRLARLIKNTTNLTFEVQVMLIGYEEDTIQSPDLTEVVYDSVKMTFDDIDSLGQLYQRDTTFMRTTYHNDRTQQQALAIINYLKGQGVDEGRLNYFVNARPELVPENRKTVIKVRAVK